jgi:hypothetical protein
MFPERSKESDGSIGNAEHSARQSDHNPDQFGIVRAIDITNDPTERRIRASSLTLLLPHATRVSNTSFRTVR